MRDFFSSTKKEKKKKSEGGRIGASKQGDTRITRILSRFASNVYCKRSSEPLPPRLPPTKPRNCRDYARFAAAAVNHPSGTKKKRKEKRTDTGQAVLRQNMSSLCGRRVLPVLHWFHVAFCCFCFFLVCQVNMSLVALRRQPLFGDEGRAEAWRLLVGFSCFFGFVFKVS